MSKHLTKFLFVEVIACDRLRTYNFESVSDYVRLDRHRGASRLSDQAIYSSLRHRHFPASTVADRPDAG
jgi:hypothetical protein